SCGSVDTVTSRFQMQPARPGTVSITGVATRPLLVDPPDDETLQEPMTDEIHPGDPESVAEEKYHEKNPGKSIIPAHHDDSEDRHKDKKNLTLREIPELTPGEP